MLRRAAWVRHIRSNQRNSHLLGSSVDLEEFLFGARRSQYPRLKEVLLELQHGACFYCSRPVRGESALDHFIPWAKYPIDLGHNFVLADRGCNEDKSDLLAEVRYREAWSERNVENDEVLAGAFSDDALNHDVVASASIADWTYALARESGTVLWMPGRGRERPVGAQSGPAI